VSDPDNDSGDSTERVITVRLNRDTLILVAALGFLGLAILLAIVFPPGTAQAPPPTLVVVIQTPMPTAAGAATPTAGGFPSTGAATGMPAGAAETPTLEAGAGREPTFAPAGVTPGAATPGAEPYPGPEGIAPSPAPGTPTRTMVDTPPSPPAQAPAATIPAFPTPSAVVSQEGGNQPASPTVPPAPTRPPPTTQPRPVATQGGSRPPARPRPTATPPPPTAVPVDLLTGNIRWTPANGPIILRRDTRLTPGSTLVIEAGTQVLLAPGAAFYVEGTLYGVGQPGNPVRFGALGGGRWDGLYGRPGGNIVLEQTEIRGGGNGGTTLASEGGTLALRGVLVTDNGGHIRVRDSRLEVRASEISGNDMPYGAALDASYTRGNFVTLAGNRIGGNRMADGAPNVEIANQTTGDTLNLDLQGNLLVGQTGPNLVLRTSGPLNGALTCNTWINGYDGLKLASDAASLPPGWNLAIRDNAIEDHTPPIEPVYTQPRHGLRRGAISDLPIDMRGNWWNDPTGPYDALNYQDGRGDAVGVNIDYSGWLTARPACAPTP
jgi:hypothetical protein